uniref:Uncharacterized protein n=1 Tax=Alexandrium catenella TaxID=2925 RepID=A0A7S1S8C2_ALECA
MENLWLQWQQANANSFFERMYGTLDSDMTTDGSGAGDQIVLLDLGCGKGSVPRTSLLQVASAFSRCYKLIRVDPQDTSVTRISSSTIVIPLSVPEALRRMQLIASTLEPEMACFIVRDELGRNVGHGAEVSAFADATMRHVCRRAVAALNNKVEKLEEPKFKVMHVHAQGHTKDLGPRDIIPDSFFFVRAHGDGEEPPVTFVHVNGLRFEGRNAQLDTRIERVGRLLVDLIKEFSEPSYQTKMSKAEDKATLQKLIREVHLRVLKLHDFPVQGADARLQQELVMQMQGFLHTGMVTPESSVLGNQTLELSGYSRMPRLPLRKGPKGGDASAGEPIASAPSSRPAWKRTSRATVVVLLRHGQREDYVALGEKRGQDWVAQTPRPWDPMLAESGRKQAQAAGKRIREVLEDNGLPAPSRIFTSPYVRCVETGQIVAQEFGIANMLVEDGLMEAVCEAWMRQWAVPGAEGRWGGPEHAMMSEDAMSNWLPTVQGPEYGAAWLRPEALGGITGLIWTPTQMADGMGGPGVSMVNAKHKGCISMRGRGYCWGNFERKEDMEQRVLDTIQARAAQNPGRTMIFVSHGGPTMHAYKGLTGNGVPKGSGGMASLSVLRKLPSRSWHWDALLSNDAQHSEAFQEGVR